MSNHVSRLEEIQQEMIGLLEEAKHLVRKNGQGMTYERAKAYWIGHIEMALSNNHDYLGKSMCSMEDTIGEMDNSSKDEDDECGRCGGDHDQDDCEACEKCGADECDCPEEP